MQSSQLSQDEAIRKKWIKPIKQHRSSWDSPSPHSLLCSKHFADDCFLSEGVHFPDEMGMPLVKRLKPDAVLAIFARSINYLEPSSTCSASIFKPTSRPVFEKQQQKSVILLYSDNIAT